MGRGKPRRARPAADHAAPRAARSSPAVSRPSPPSIRRGARGDGSSAPARRGRPGLARGDGQQGTRGRGAPRAPPPAALPRAPRALPGRRVLRNGGRHREQSAEQSGTGPATCGRRATWGTRGNGRCAPPAPTEPPRPFSAHAGAALGRHRPRPCTAPARRSAPGPAWATGPAGPGRAWRGERYRRGKSAGAGGPCSPCPWRCPPSRGWGTTQRECCAAGGRALKEAPCPPTR